MQLPARRYYKLPAAAQVRGSSEQLLQVGYYKQIVIVTSVMLYVILNATIHFTQPLVNMRAALGRDKWLTAASAELVSLFGC